MSLAEIKREALALDHKDRISLAVALLETIPIADDISDEEALQRDLELEQGLVQEINHEEFVRSVKLTRH